MYCYLFIHVITEEVHTIVVSFAHVPVCLCVVFVAVADAK